MGWGLCASTGLLLAVFLFVPVHYAVNDDFGFLMDLAGRDGFVPSSSGGSPFLSNILSQLLYLLYQNWNFIPWYGIALTCSILWGHALVLATLLSLDARRWEAVWLVPAWSAVSLHHLCSLTFTSVALTLSLAVFLLLLLQQTTNNANVIAFHPSLLVATLGLAYLWRWELVLFSVVFAGPLLLYARGHPWKRLGLWLLPLVALVLVDRGWEYLRVRDPDYRAYRDYLELETPFHDAALGQPGPHTAMALNKTGWSAEDYRAFQHWLLFDEQLFNAERLRVFLTHNRDADSPIGLSTHRVRMALNNTCELNRHFLPVMAWNLVALLLLRLSWFWEATPRARWRAIAAIAILVCLCLAAACYRFPLRISLPVFSYVLGVVLLVTRRNTSESAAHNSGRALSTLRVVLTIAGWAALVIAGWQAQHRIRGDLSSRRTDARRYQLIQSSLHDVQREFGPAVLVYLNATTGLGQELVHPLRERLLPPGLRLVPGGWRIHSPRYQRVLRELQFTNGRNFLTGIVNRNDILLVGVEYPGYPLEPMRQLWESYYRRNVAQGAPSAEKAPVVVRQLRRWKNAQGEAVVLYGVRSE